MILKGQTELYNYLLEIISKTYSRRQEKLPNKYKSINYYIDEKDFDLVEHIELKPSNIFYTKVDNKSVIHYFNNLKSITITKGFNYIEILNEVLHPENINKIMIDGAKLTYIDLSKYINLKKLIISNCRELKEIKGLTKIKEINDFSFYNNQQVDKKKIINFVKNTMQNKSSSLKLDIIYFKQVSEIIRDSFAEYKANFKNIIWIEDTSSDIEFHEYQNYSTMEFSQIHSKLSDIQFEIGTNIAKEQITKVYLLYSWICQNIKYNSEFLKGRRRHIEINRIELSEDNKDIYITNRNSSETNSLENIISKKETNSQGLTRLFRYLLNMLNIECYEIQAHKEERIKDFDIRKPSFSELMDSEINHSIARLVLGKNHYYCDITFDSIKTQKDEKQSQEYFLKTIKEITNKSYPVNDEIHHSSEPVSEEKRNNLNTKKVKKQSDSIIKERAKRLIETYSFHFNTPRKEHRALKEYEELKEKAKDLLLLDLVSNRVYKEILKEIEEEYKVNIARINNKKSIKK